MAEMLHRTMAHRAASTSGNTCDPPAIGLARIPKPRFRTVIRRRTIAVVARASDPGGSSTAGPNRALVSTIIDQVRKETLPWVDDLLQPFILGQPEPLTDTVPPQQLADPDSRWIEVDGVNLHYKDYGPKTPGAPAVLLLHGFNGSTFNWRHLMEPLAGASCFPGGCRMIAFDRPPFGLTERPLQWEGGDANNPYTPEGGARLAAGLLQRLGVKQAVVVGHSAGGLTALELHRRAPDLVAGLLLVAPAIPMNNPEGNTWSRGGSSLGSKLRLGLTRAILQMDGPGLHYIRRSYRKQAAQVARGNHSGLNRSDGGGASQDVIEGYLKPMRSDNWDRGSLLSLRAMSFPGTYPYERITQPVLTIIGENDKFLLKTAQRVHELLQGKVGAPSSQLQVYEECGHVPMDDCKERFQADVTAFVESVFCQGAGAETPVRGYSEALQSNGAGVDAMQADPDAQAQVAGSSR